MIEFSSYQDTNTPWIGEIPTDWSLKSLKHIFTEKKSTKNPDLGCGSISFGKVVYKDDEKIPESTKESYQEVLDGEFLINPLNLNYDLKSLRIGLSRINVVVSQGYIVLNIKDGFVPDYFEYLLRKFDVEHMKSLGQGVRQTISYTHLKDEKLVVPPVEEQNRISRYLDKRTSRIDALINNIEKKIEVLKEQRTSLINQYVTKGLDPNVEMKDSGVEWIGEIPRHWEMRKITHATTLIGSGTTPKSDNEAYYLDGATNWLVTGDLNDGYVIQTSSKVTEKALKDHSSLKLYPTGSLLMAMYGATIGKLGILKVEVTVNQATCVMNFNENNSVEFWFNVLFGNRNYIVSLGYGGGQPNISQGLIKSLRFPCPPTIKEQLEIVEAIKSRIGKHDSVIQMEHKRLLLSKEYRQSFISSVVTGKVRVTEEMI